MPASTSTRSTARCRTASASRTPTRIARTSIPTRRCRRRSMPTAATSAGSTRARCRSTIRVSAIVRPGVGALRAEHGSPTTFDPNPTPLDATTCSSTASMRKLHVHADRSAHADARACATTITTRSAAHDHWRSRARVVGHAVDASCARATAKASRRRRCISCTASTATLALDAGEARRLGCRHRAASARRAAGAVGDLLRPRHDRHDRLRLVLRRAPIAALRDAALRLLRQRAEDRGRRRRARA